MFVRDLTHNQVISFDIMKIHDERISEDLYSEFLAHLPQVSVELFLEVDGEVLLAKRNNKPLRGEWFWPGSRLYKGEEIREAAHRVAKEELGIGIEIKGLLGVYGHFWEETEIDNANTIHTVNIVYYVHPAEDVTNISLDDQHDDYKWISEIKPEFHEYVKLYLKESGLFE